jgi:hypothetical protein
MTRKLLKALVPVGLFALAFGVYVGSPSEIRVEAQNRGSDAPWQSALVSMRLVQGRVQRVFLPIVVRVAIEGPP